MGTEIFALFDLPCDQWCAVLNQWDKERCIQLRDYIVQKLQTEYNKANAKEILAPLLGKSRTARGYGIPKTTTVVMPKAERPTDLPQDVIEWLEKQ